MNSLLCTFGSVVSLAGAGLIAQQPASPPKVAEGKIVEGKVVEGKVAAADKSKTKFSVEKAGKLRAAQGQIAGTGGNSWFDVTSIDLGTFYGTGDGVGVFEFENPNDMEVTWSNLTPSCQCASAEIEVEDRLYRLTSKPKRVLLRVTREPGKPDKTEPVQMITIGPKEKGKVMTRLDMRNITGNKQASLDIHTTDPKLPHSKLSFHAKGAQLFSISPADVQLNEMTWNETRDFEVRVTSSMQENWQIVGMDDAGEAFDVSWEQADGNAWVIKGKYGPVNSDVGGGGVLKFRTNVNGAASFNVRVLAFVRGPLEVKPGGFLTLGLIRQGKPLKKEVVFEPNDGTELEATALEFQKTTLSTEYISATSRKDGNKLIVELAISADAPKGLVKGDLVVQLNHPLVKEKRIMFNGFVR